jgi:hypothetical protein
VKDYSPQRCRVHRGYLLLPFLPDLSASALKIVADPSFGGSAVQFPSPCTEIALARLATQKPEYPNKDSRRSELIAIAETRGVNHGSSGTTRSRSEWHRSAIIVWKREPDPKAPDRLFSAGNKTPPPGFWETPVVLEYLTRWVRLRLRAALWRQWKRPRRRRAALIALGVRPRLASNTAASNRCAYADQPMLSCPSSMVPGIPMPFSLM